MLRTVMTRLIFIVLISLVLVSCSINKLDREMKRADESYGYIKVVAPAETQFGGSILIALYVTSPEERKIVGFRSPAPGEEAAFLVPISSYQLVAFEDINGDFVYQKGEPVQERTDLLIITQDSLSEDGYIFDELPAQTLELSAQYALDFTLDLSLQSLNRQREGLQNNFLVVVDWEDPRFSPDSIKRGMWEPLSFQEKVGFGFYLLEPLDLSKQPVLFVHGINGSPTQFRELAQSLGDRYQAILYQYPSGFPLNHSAYMLQVAIDAFLKIHPETRLSIVAHSMGGLVARGAIVISTKDTTDKVDAFVTLSTPWMGHEAARLGVKWSPTVAPVWRSMVPNSNYLQRIFYEPLPEKIDHYLFFSYARERGGPSKGDDGVVTVKSQLGARAQMEASTIYGIDDNHNGILNNACMLNWIRTALPQASVKAEAGRTDVPSPQC